MKNLFPYIVITMLVVIAVIALVINPERITATAALVYLYKTFRDL